MQKEIWKDVVSYEKHYQVSSYGRVKSLDRVNVRGHKIKGKMLNPAYDGRGYLMVGLSLNGNQKSRKVHQLVAEAFLNHVPNGYGLLVDHIDNNKLNNNLSNLQVISNRENCSKDKNGGTSKYIGVCFDSHNKKYMSSCRYKGKSVNLGRFKTEIEASEAYNNFLKSITNK